MGVRSTAALGPRTAVTLALALLLALSGLPALTPAASAAARLTATPAAVTAVPAPALGRLSSGGFHSCALTADGVAYCWGLNTSGQLGGSFAGQSPAPVPVTMAGLPAGTTFSSISAGPQHTCAVTTAGALYCWGDNTYGELGDATTTRRFVPVPVSTSALPAGTTFAQVTTGNHTTCAVAVSGSLYCWGYNGQGQIGDGSTTNRTLPTAVDTSALPASTSFSVVSTSNGHSCALSTTGAAYCWGSSFQGRLGDGTTTDRLTPVAVAVGALPAGTTFTSITTGELHTCAVSAGGAAYCWGSGVLGDGGTLPRLTPTAVSTSGLPPGTSFVSVASQASHTCVVSAGGIVYCWGQNGFGQLGDGTTSTRLTPVAVSSAAQPVGTTFVAVDTGQGHTCAITASTTVYCWGTSHNGQRGDGTSGAVTTPTGVAWPAPQQSSTTALAAGLNFSCAVTGPGLISCWGANSLGQLGDGTASSRDVPGPVSVVRLPAGTTFSGLAAGSSHACAVSSSGGLSCWGFNAFGQLGTGGPVQELVPTPVSTAGLPPSTTFTGVAAGSFHTCALASSGTVYCWGRNGSGELGDGTTVDRTTPVAVSLANVPSDTTFTSVAAGGDHTCALAASGAAYCWGGNGGGQLGDGTTTNRLAPVPASQAGLPAGTTYGSLAVGAQHSCALTTAGAAYCWGARQNGALGDGGPTIGLATTPVAVATSALPAGTTFVSASAGTAGACAVSATSQLFCWGINGYGQVGDGTQLTRSAPVSAGVPVGESVTAVAAAQEHTCAATVMTVYCWGLSEDGRLGRPGAWLPVQVMDFPPDRPQVTVVAPDATATENSADTGTFRFTRTGSIAASLRVTYTVAGGTGQAVPGTNYTALSGSVVIPAGATSATVTVTPLNDTVSTGPLDVTVNVVPTAEHVVGEPGAATVTIADDDIAPSLTITSPADGASIPMPRNGSVPVTATATTAAGDDVSASIEWLVGGQVVATGGTAAIPVSGTGTVDLTARVTTGPGLVATATWSFAVTAVAPDAPTNISLTPRGQALDVGWTAPSFTGGVPLTGYTVTASAPGAPTSLVIVSFPSSETSATVSGLTAGVAYEVTVRAESGAGTATSDPAFATPLLPKSFGLPTLSVPEGDSGPVLVDVAVTVSPPLTAPATIGLDVNQDSTPEAQATVPAGVTEYVFTGVEVGTGDLLLGSDRDVILRLLGPDGTELATGKVTIVEDDVRPTITIVSPADGAVIPFPRSGVVTATGSAADGQGRDLTSALTWFVEGQTVGTGASGDFPVTGSGSLGVNATVTDVKGIGQTTSVFITVEAVAPDAPTGVSATAGTANGTASVTWAAPSFTGGAPISAFRVRAVPSDGGATVEVEVPADQSQALLAGLSVGVTYTVTVTTVTDDFLSGLLTSAPSTAATLTLTQATRPGLVAAYGFGEGSGTAVLDGSGRGNNGTAAGTAWTTTGKVGGALSFSANNARVTVPDASSLDLTTGMTVMAWVRPTTRGNTLRAVLVKEDPAATNLSYALYSNQNTTTTGGPTGRIRTGTTATSAGGNAIPLNAWSHLAVTYDGASLRYYLNGVLTRTTARTGAINVGTGPLVLGGSALLGGQQFLGQLDEVRVYNRALTVAELVEDRDTPVPALAQDAQPPVVSVTAPTAGASVKGAVTVAVSATDNAGVAVVRVRQGGVLIGVDDTAGPGGTYEIGWDTTGIANGPVTLSVEAVDSSGNVATTTRAVTVANPIPTGLVAGYGFGEAGGTSAADASGTGNTGTVVNATRGAGRYGQGLVLNGNNTRVTVPDAANLRPTRQLTVMAWVNTTTLSSNRAIAYKENGNTLSYALYGVTGGRGPSGAVRSGAPARTASARGAALLPLRTWVHLAVTYDGTTVRLFRDGVQVAATTTTGAVVNGSGPLSIGGDVNGEWFAGTLDEVRVYNRTLSAAEIRTASANPLP